MSGDDDSGLYQLLLHLPRPVEVTVGRLGSFAMAAGFYVYTGSALRARSRRVARHRAATKPLRWHIDYLTSVACVVDVRLMPSTEGECACHQRLLARPGVTTPIAGFGSSDCRHGCPAHLAYLGADAALWPGNPTNTARGPEAAGRE